MRITISDFPAKSCTLTVREIVALARRTEEVGLDRFAITDWPYYFDCVATMAACLSGTEHLVVESLVTTPYARHPEAIACAFATMHEVSQGCVILGIGAGVEDPSSVWMPPWGHARPLPVRAVRELVDLCRAMWAGEESPVTGEILRGSGLALKFPVAETLPILIAARGPQMLELAGALADVVHIAPPFLGPAYIDGCIEHVRRGAERNGRTLSDLEIDLTISTAIGSDGEHARHLAKVVTAYGIIWMTGVEKFAQQRPNWEVPQELDLPQELVDLLSTSWNMWSGEPLPDECQEMIDKGIIEQFSVAGEPHECAEKFKDLQQRHPELTGFRLKLPPLTGPRSFPDYDEMIRATAEAVADL